jgi:hypothetical protein
MADGGLTDGDRTWLEARFSELRGEMRGQDTRIGDLRIDVNTLKVGNVHKCSEAIQKHEASSWAHNPYKATGLLGGVLGVFEAAKKFFGH